MSIVSVIRSSKAVLDVVSTLAVTAAAVFLIWSLLRGTAPSIGNNQPGTLPKVETLSGTRLAAGALRNKKGSGKIALVEFTDYQCPYCADYEKRIVPDIARSYIDTGKLLYAVVDFPLEQMHPLAFKAHEAAECAAAQGKFWEMHKSLFAASPALARSELSRYGADLQLDQSRFERCLDAQETVEKIRSDQAEGKRLQVGGTPTFLIGLVQQDGSIDVRKKFNGMVTMSDLKAEFANLASN